MVDVEKVKQQLAPQGVLRVGINMANFLLVTGELADGSADGVSPDIARALASELGVEARMVPFKGPGELADALASDAWDIGNIANEAERAKTIRFSQAYCEIQATYMVPPNSPITTLEEVDREGVRIAVKDRAAYDLWLRENLQHAQLVRAESIDGSFDLFVEQKLDVLAGLRPALTKQQESLAGSVILDGSFTAIQQSIGCKQGMPEAATFINDFVQRSITGGLVADSIKRHGVEGRLTVATVTTGT